MVRENRDIDRAARRYGIAFVLFAVSSLASQPSERLGDEPAIPKRDKPLELSRKNYALLFSGPSEYYHVNDLEFLYRTLVDSHGFEPANILVLNSNGAVRPDRSTASQEAPRDNLWPGDGTPYRMVVRGPGTKAALDAALDELRTRLQPGDSLLIHANGRGDIDEVKGPLLRTFGDGPDYYPANLASKLARLPKLSCLTVMMEQCHSGAFIGPVSSSSPAERTSIATACSASGESFHLSDFDPFARDWISAMAGHTPSGRRLEFDPDTNKDGRVSASEAFSYAKKVKPRVSFDNAQFGEVAGGGDCSWGPSSAVFQTPRFLTSTGL
jgi:hypothetical protein